MVFGFGIGHRTHRAHEQRERERIQANPAPHAAGVLAGGAKSGGSEHARQRLPQASTKLCIWAPGEGTDGAKQAARGRLMMMYYTDNRAPRADPFACVSFTPLRAGSNMMNCACCC